MKRPLTEEEKKMTYKSMTSKDLEIRWMEYQVKYYDLMLLEGLEMNYLKQRRDMEAMRRELQSELTTSLAVKKEMDKQLREGVEMKEDKLKEDKK